MTIVIRPDGTARCLYDETIRLAELGQATNYPPPPCRAGRRRAMDRRPHPRPWPHPRPLPYALRRPGRRSRMAGDQPPVLMTVRTTGGGYGPRPFLSAPPADHPLVATRTCMHAQPGRKFFRLRRARLNTNTRKAKTSRALADSPPRGGRFQPSATSDSSGIRGHPAATLPSRPPATC